MLPDSDHIAQDAVKMRAYHAMLDARDIAHRCEAHAQGLRDLGAPDAAQVFAAAASTFRAIEKSNATVSGVAGLVRSTYHEVTKAIHHDDSNRS